MGESARDELPEANHEGEIGETIVAEEENDEEEKTNVKTSENDGFFSGSKFTPEEVEEVEREELPVANHEGEIGENEDEVNNEPTEDENEVKEAESTMLPVEAED